VIISSGYWVVGHFENDRRHTRESGYPEDLSSWIPAYAGMMAKKKEISKTKLTHDRLLLYAALGSIF
jgi:hypothetical protein